MAITPVSGLPQIPAVPQTRMSGTENAAKAGDFGDLVQKGIQAVQDSNANADTLAQKAATGTLTDVHDFMIAANQAQLTTQFAVTVKNKAVEAFQEIMRMPV